MDKLVNESDYIDAISNWRLHFIFTCTEKSFFFFQKVRWERKLEASLFTFHWNVKVTFGRRHHWWLYEYVSSFNIYRQVAGKPAHT